jgi:hypothetical protein
MFTMQPRARRRIPGRTARLVRNALLRLLSSTCRHSSWDIAAIGLKKKSPTLFTSASIGPSRSSASATAPAASSGSVTSAATATALLPRPRMPSTTSPAASSLER